MKHLYSIFCLFILIGFNAYGQSDLLGTWYLDHVIKNGVTYPNHFNDHTIFDIEFTNSLGDLPNTLAFNSGHGCNASNGSYNLNSNEVTVNISGTTLADCQTRPYAIYEMLYYDELDYNNGLDSVLTYTITGNTTDETLTLTNPNNGNTIVFKKEIPPSLLVSTWWLYQIDIPGNPIIDIPDNGGLYMSLTNNVSPNPLLPEIDGFGGCNSFYAKYSVSFNGSNNMSIPDFVATLIGCSLDNYEGYYFSILSNIATNFFEFEIINEGATLILTDLLGAKLIFGNVSLSIGEENLRHSKISLIENPVEDLLRLKIDDDLMAKHLKYQIYSIEGKAIEISKLSENSINVEFLNPGIYFIRFSDTQRSSTLKFIKK